MDPNYSCEYGAAFMEFYCETPWGSRSVEVDWLRFWWDLHTDEGEPFGNIADIWDGANPEFLDRRERVFQAAQLRHRRRRFEFDMGRSRGDARVDH
ncbi:MAG: hypothetical protein M5R36_17835 [Deltaproteobacteria bacterium]|nr:hypothetical protein [Deltaproteobacteria bacterium]